jgi:hypothetical protein
MRTAFFLAVMVEETRLITKSLRMHSSTSFIWIDSLKVILSS